MASTRIHVLRRIGFATLALSLAAAAGLATTARVRPVSHIPPSIAVGTSSKVGVALTGTTHSVEVVVIDAHGEVVIGAEFEGGPNDPDNLVESWDISYGSPDASCIVPAGDFLCTLELYFFAPSAGDSIRVYIASGDALIDTQEGPVMQPGCTPEPNATEALRITAVGVYREPATPSDPPPGVDPEPEDACADPGPSPSASATTSPTTSPTATPTETLTGTPTPTETITVTPTPTPTATLTPEPVELTPPYEGRYRRQRCSTFLPAGAQAPCYAEGQADPQSGAASAVAAITPSEGSPATLADADASAGVIQSLRTGPARILVRFRVHRAAIETSPALPATSGPGGSLELWVLADSNCARATSARAIPLDGNDEIENQLFEVWLDYDGCDTLSSITAGVRATASTTPSASGRARSEVNATIEQISLRQ